MRSALTESYCRHTRRKALALWVLALVTLVLGLATLSIGSITMTPSQVVSTLLGRGDPLVQTALYQNRLPRLLSAILVGASLASSGAVMQCVLRNPLASASTLGVSQGAAFGAALGIVVFGGGMVNSASATSSIAIRNPYTRRLHETGRVYDADLEDIAQRQEQLWEGVKEILTQLSRLS